VKRIPTPTGLGNPVDPLQNSHPGFFGDFEEI
jgi:hypothetical protein